MAEKQKAIRKKSKYDEFYNFKYINDKEKEAECKLCTSPNRKKIRMQNNGTNGIKNHLQSKHKDAYCKIFNITDEEAGEKKNVHAEDIYDHLCDWVAQKYLPFSFFEDEATQNLFKRLNPKIEYPKKDSLKRKIVKRYQDLKLAVKNILLKNESKFAFTTDGWTSVSNSSIYGITNHFIDSEWRLNSLALDFVPSNGRHTGEDISRIFSDAVKEYGIEEKISGITVDNTSSNTLFMSHLSDKIPSFDKDDGHFRCIAHILNLAVQDFLKELNLMPAKDSNENECFFDSYQEEENETEDSNDSTNSVNKIRSLFCKIKKSEQTKIKFQQLCKAEEIPHDLVPILDVRTRWNSTYEMLQRGVTLSPALDLLCCRVPELSIFKQNEIEWEMITKVCKILKNFKNLSEMLGGEHYVTLPSVIGAFNLLLDKMETLIAKNRSKKKNRSDLDLRMLSAYEAAHSKLIKHYNKTNWVYCAVLILDPRFKVEGFMQYKWGRDMYKASKKKFDDLYRSYQHQESTTGEQTSDSEANDNDDDMEIDYSSLYCKAQKENDYEKELQDYLSLPRATENQDILLWWKLNHKQFPTLAKMARDFLCIPATSVPSERLFSKAALIVRKHRNRLTPESAKYLLCLNSWTTCNIAKEIISYKKPEPCVPEPRVPESGCEE